MKPFLALLGVNFKSLLLTSMNIGRGKKKAASGVGALLLISFLMLFISGTYAFTLGATLAPSGALDIMLMVIIIFAIAFSLMITLFSGQSLVFSTKDLDLVLSLPLSSFSVMLARIMALYLEILLMVELMLLPAGISYIVFGGGGAGMLVMLLIMGIFLSFLPTLICLVFGTLISLLIARLRFKNLFTVIFSLLFFVAIFVVSMSFGFGMEQIEANPMGIQDMLYGLIPPLGWLVKAVTVPNLLYFFLIAAACSLSFFIVTWLFSLFFRPLLSSLSSHAMRRDFKLKGVRGGSATGALLRKEAGKFFGTPAFLLNYGIGILIIVGASVFAAFNKSTISEFFVMLSQNQLGEDMEFLSGVQLVEMASRYLPAALFAVAAFFLCTICSTAVSISLEGKTLWILKEAPITTKTIFAAKIGFNVLLSAGSMLVTSLFLGYAFSLHALDILGMILLGAALSVFISASGLFINLLMPRLDAENETIIIKQSGSVIVSMLAGLFATALLGGLWALSMFVFGLSFFVFSLLGCALMALLCGVIIAMLDSKGLEIFKNL